MSYADFIEDVRVAVCAIADDNARTVDQGDDILNDRGIFPDIVSATATKPDVFRSLSKGFINRREERVKRHHSRKQPWFDPFMLRDIEYGRALPARLRISDENPVKVQVLYGRR